MRPPCRLCIHSRLPGSSYWASDLVLPIALALALPLVVVMVGLLSAVRMVTRAGRDPVGTLRKRTQTSRLTLRTSPSAGIVAGPAAMFCRVKRRTLRSLGRGCIAAGMILSIVGLEGLSRDRGDRSYRQTALRLDAGAGGRITDVSRGGAEAVLGVSATSVAVLLIVFSVYANIDNRPPRLPENSTCLPDFRSRCPIRSRRLNRSRRPIRSRRPNRVVRAMEEIDGVTRVVVGGDGPFNVGSTEGLRDGGVDNNLRRRATAR